MKKMQLPKKLDSAEEMSDDDVDDMDLVTKKSESSFMKFSIPFSNTFCCNFRG